MRATCLLGMLLVCAGTALAQPEPTPVQGLVYDVDFFPGTVYDPTIPTPEDLLGFMPGERAAFPHEIELAILAWGESSPRVTVVEYARSHEGRALYYAIITSPANLAHIDSIRSGLARLADPRGLDDGEAEALITGLPGTAWLAYSIHGDETSGADAALAVIYHLAAAQGDPVEGMLDDLVILVDPMMNPDGRNRFLQQIAEHRGTQPNVDDQSLLHRGYWPWGRTNHYGFDLNRDWILGINPETKGRIREASLWHPLLFVDAHEMGSQDTYLFSPQREPRNPHVPSNRDKWGRLFALEQSEAFDRYGWAYYTGEWNEGWYPGYSDVWGEFRGAVGILYEQARFAEDGVRRPGGSIHSYREAVHHQAVSSLANLMTLQANVADLRRDILAERRVAVSANGPFARRTFAVLPTENRSRLRGFTDLMALQGFEFYRTTSEFRASGTDQLGQSFQGRTIPAGTILIPNRQPEGHQVATMLEFDTRMSPGYVERERKAIVRTGSSTIYDVTAWNLTMMHGLEALSLETGLPSEVEAYAEVDDANGGAVAPGSAVAWAVDGSDDASVAVAARLMERGVEVRLAKRAFELGGVALPRGSLVILRNDNRAFADDLAGVVRLVAEEAGLTLASLTAGLGEGELPDLGGGHFDRLEPPRIAIVSRDGMSVYDFGSIWYTLDHRIGIRHSHIDGAAFEGSDLRRYNVIVLPDRWWGEWSEGTLEALERWVESGGTLIAIGGSAGQVAGSESSLSSVRLLRDVLDDLDTYQDQVLREWMALEGIGPDSAAVWSHAAGTAGAPPWSEAGDLDRSEAEELGRVDRWQRMFMPAGAVLAARTDQEHWLTVGTGAVLPVLYNSSRVFMSASGVQAAVRAGVYRDAPGEAVSRVGWSVVPAGQILDLRMSGLLWPEAGERLANAALVTRERKGNGQVILFAASPTFRASTRGTERLLVNAMIYGPGLGTRPAIEP